MQQELDARDQQAATLQQSVQSLQGAVADAQQEQQQLHIQLQHARSAEGTGASERSYLQAELSTLQQALQAKSSAVQSQQEAMDCMSAQMQSKVGLVAAFLLIVPSAEHVLSANVTLCTTACLDSVQQPLTCIHSDAQRVEV